MSNIFEFPDYLPDELIENLAVGPNVTVERIVTYNSAEPGKHWYESELDEFVLLLRGKAVLQDTNNQIYTLLPGDYLVIPRRLKHQVIFTREQPPTVWLTVYGRFETG